MSLTVGSGPFGHQPAGSFDFERLDRVVYTEPSPRRIRAVLGSETVIESRRVRLLYETGSLPVFFFPEEDVRLDLVPSAAVRRHEAVSGYVAVDWSVPDAWFEEREEIFGHPRDPYHRIDVRESARLVRVLVEDGRRGVAPLARPLRDRAAAALLPASGRCAR